MDSGPDPVSEIDWSALEPRGWYLSFGRPALFFVLHLLILPVAVLLGVAIAAINWVVFGDPRRILFFQPRVGHRGKVFRLVKFRTMREAPEGSFEAWSGGREQARVTRFGRFLRNSHLDELAQMMNVIRGDMAIIGPRPEMLEIESWAQENVAGFSHRLVLKPGITGLAQITQGYTGRDVNAYRRKFEINEEYRRQVSLRFDLLILWRTVRWMLCGRGWQWNDSTNTQPVDTALSAGRMRVGDCKKREGRS